MKTYTSLQHSLRKRFNSITRLKFSILEEKKLRESLESIIEQESYNLYHTLYKDTRPLKLDEIAESLHPTLTAKKAEEAFLKYLQENFYGKEPLKNMITEYFSRKLLTKRRIQYYKFLKEQYIKFLYYNSSQATILPLLELLLEEELSQVDLKATQINTQFYFFKKELEKRILQKGEKRLLKNLPLILQSLSEKEITSFWINQYTQTTFIEWWIEYSKSSIILDFTFSYLKEKIKKPGKQYHWYDPRINFEEETQYLDPKEYVLERTESIETINKENIVVNAVIIIRSLNRFFKKLYEENKEVFLYSYLELSQRLMEKKQK